MSKAEDIGKDGRTRRRVVLFHFSRTASIRTNDCRAFSIVELMLIVVILGAFALVAVPRLDYGIVKRHKAEATAKKIVTALRLTRGMAISDAATNTKGFDMRMLEEPGPYSSYQIKNGDTQATVVSHTIDSDVSVTGNPLFPFEPLGNLQMGGNPQLTVSAEGKSFTITVVGATGVTKCVEN